MAHDYEGGITAESISILSKPTDVLKQSFNYPQGTPSINPLNVMLGEYEETSWHKHSVPLWVYLTEGSFTVDYGSKGKKVMNKGMSYIEAMNWCHKGAMDIKSQKQLFFIWVQSVQRIIFHVSSNVMNRWGMIHHLTAQRFPPGMGLYCLNKNCLGALI